MSSGLRECTQSHDKGVVESPRDDLGLHTFCHPWKYSSRRFLKQSSARAARERARSAPRPRLQYGRISREGVGRRRQIDKKKKVKRWWTGSKPSSENPTVEPARVSDADPLLSPPRHDFHRFLSERWPLRTTRTTNLRLRSQIHRFVAPCIVYSRIPRYFHPRNMSSASTRKRKADSNASPSSTSTKVQKSVYYHMFVNISCELVHGPQQPTRSSPNQTRPVPNPPRPTNHASSG